MKDLVSVIIPVYNADVYLIETLRSVMDQTYDRFEVLVIDDGSPDQVEAIIRSVEDSGQKIRYIRQENKGVSDARNNGVLKSKGQFVAFLDSDDLWMPDNLERKVELLISDPDLGLVHSDAEIIDENSVSMNRFRRGKSGHILKDLLSWNGECIPSPSSILLRRGVLEKVGKFDEMLSNAADQEFFFRVANVYKIGRIPEVTWKYRLHGQNMHANIRLMESDAHYTFRKARTLKLFESRDFERFCFAKMYLILGANWWRDGKNKGRGILYFFRAIFRYPAIITTFWNMYVTKSQE